MTNQDLNINLGHPFNLITLIEKIGVGIDIVDVSRFKKVNFSSKPTFYEKIFLPSEIKYCLKFNNSHEHFAAKFAIKEAVKKSINETMSMLDIETSHSNSKPKIRIRKRMRKRYHFSVSITHERQFAIAVVLSELLN